MDCLPGLCCIWALNFFLKEKKTSPKIATIVIKTVKKTEP